MSLALFSGLISLDDSLRYSCAHELTQHVPLDALQQLTKHLRFDDEHELLRAIVEYVVVPSCATSRPMSLETIFQEIIQWREEEKYLAAMTLLRVILTRAGAAPEQGSLLKQLSHWAQRQLLHSTELSEERDAPGLALLTALSEGASFRLSEEEFESIQRLAKKDEENAPARHTLALDALLQRLRRTQRTSGISPRLVPVSGDLTSHSTLELSDIHKRYKIGRGLYCDLVLNDVCVHRTHAEMRYRDGSIFINDMDNREGVILNGEYIPKATDIELHAGDEVTFANSHFRFEDPERARLSVGIPAVPTPPVEQPGIEEAVWITIVHSEASGSEGFDPIQKRRFQGVSAIHIGRSPTNDITLPDATVSGIHAYINYYEGEYQLVDPGSQNGVILNGQLLPPHQPRVLCSGDKILIRPYDLTFVQGPEPATFAMVQQSLVENVLGGLLREEPTAEADAPPKPSSPGTTGTMLPSPQMAAPPMGAAQDERRTTGGSDYSPQDTALLPEQTQRGALPAAPPPAGPPPAQPPEGPPQRTDGTDGTFVPPIAPPPKTTSRPLRTFERWLSDGAGRPGPVERFVAQSRSLMKLFHATLYLRFVPLVSALDALLEMFTEYVHRVFHTWKSLRAAGKKWARQRDGALVRCMGEDLLTTRIHTARILKLSGYLQEKERLTLLKHPAYQDNKEPTLLLEQILFLRGHLDEMKRDLDVLPGLGEQLSQTFWISLRQALANLVPNPFAFLVSWKDLLIMAFSMQYSRQELRQSYENMVWHNIQLLRAEQAKDEEAPGLPSHLLSWASWEKRESAQVGGTNSGASLGQREATAQVQEELSRLLCVLCFPWRFVDPNQWSMEDLLYAMQVSSHGASLHPAISMAFERQVRNAVKSALPSTYSSNIEEQEARAHEQMMFRARIQLLDKIERAFGHWH